MRRRAALLVTLAAGACRIPHEHFVGLDGGMGGIDAARFDAPPPADAGPPCDPTATFGPLEPVGGLSGLSSIARFSQDERTAYFTLQDDSGTNQLYRATRLAPDGDFGDPVKLANVNDADGEITPFLDPGGMDLFFTHGSPPNFSQAEQDIYFATRTSLLGDFTAGQEVATVNSMTAQDDHAWVDSNGDLWFDSARVSPIAIYRAPRGPSGFEAPVLVTELQGNVGTTLPMLSPDLRQIFMARTGTNGKLAAYSAFRSAPDGTFSSPQPVPELASSDVSVRPSWISPDGCRIYVALGAPEVMYVATRPRP